MARVIAIVLEEPSDKRLAKRLAKAMYHTLDAANPEDAAVIVYDSDDAAWGLKGWERLDDFELPRTPL